MARDTFERFYLQRVALSEACGCAEAVIRFRNIDERRAKEGRASESPRLGFTSRLGRVFGGLWTERRGGFLRNRG